MRTVSSRYRSIDTVAMTDAITAELTSLGANITHKTHGLGSNKDLTIFNLNNYKTQDFGGITPTIKFFNSHDGSSKAKFQVGFQRLICNNGCTISEDLFKHEVIHIKGDATERAIEMIPAAMAAAMKYIESELLEYLAVLQETKVTKEQMVDIASSLNIPKSVKERVVKSARDEEFRPTYDQDNSLFSLYNFTNQYIREGRKSTVNSQEKWEKTLLKDIATAAEALVA